MEQGFLPFLVLWEHDKIAVFKMFVLFVFVFNKYLGLLKFSGGACQICSELHISALLSMLLIFEDEKFCSLQCFYLRQH